MRPLGLPRLLEAVGSRPQPGRLRRVLLKRRVAKGKHQQQGDEKMLPIGCAQGFFSTLFW